MNRSSIYNRVTAVARQSDCSFGASGGFHQEVQVGWGKSNSHTLGKIEVTEVVIAPGVVEFCLYLDGHLLKRGTKRGADVQIESCTFK